MRNIWTIAKREFNYYWVSPVAYVVTAIFLIVLGLIYSNYLGGTMFRGGAPDPVRWVLSPFVTLTLFLMPALTMRAFTEEQRSGTIELLMTAPVREWELVLGKWLAAMAFAGAIVIITLLYAVITNNYTQPALHRDSLLVAYAGILLFIGAVLAIGVFVSTLFSNQIAALFTTFGITVTLWLLGPALQNQGGEGSAFATVAEYLNISARYYDSFFVGTVSLRDLIYFLSLISLFLFLAARTIESRRWR